MCTMKKIPLATIIALILSITAYSQGIKRSQTEETKMETFSSQTGVISKFIDYNLPNLRLTYGNVKTRIRIIISGAQKFYFYQIEKAGQYSSDKASIEYSDLLEVIKALGSLSASLQSDINANPDYLENKFITEDGFIIGYYVTEGKSSWYLKLEKGGSDNTVFINDAQTIEAALLNAKNKIESLKSQG